MPIIITGASGQLGRLVVDELLHSVPANALVLITRTPEKLSSYANRGCKVRGGNFDHPQDLISAFDGGEKMLLISGTRVGRRVEQHGAAIDAAKRAGVKHVLYTTYIGVEYSANECEAVKDHRSTEELLRRSGLAWTALRHAQYANAVTDVMAQSAVQNRRLISVAGDGLMPFIWREDCAIADAAAAAGPNTENKAYDITGPELMSFRQVAAMMAEFSGVPVDFRLTDVNGLYAMFDALGVPREPVDDLVANGIPWNSNEMVSFEVAVRDGHFAVKSDDFKRLTGREPRTLRALFDAKSDQIRSYTRG